MGGVVSFFLEKTDMLTNEQVAQVAHEANRAYCRVIGDNSQVPWDEAPSWQRESAIHGVEAIREGRTKVPSDSHTSWSAEKLAAGWTYGPVKDAEAKTHPCLVPFEELPKEQQLKDALFFAVVTALS